MAKDWSVVDQRQTSELGAGGRFRDVMEIVAQTRTGVTFSVRVPVDQYDPDNVAPLLDQQARRILAVGDL